jgi:hypothetical protein
MPIKDDLLVKIFGGYVAQKQTILEELERHRQTHQEKLSTRLFAAVPLASSYGGVAAGAITKLLKIDEPSGSAF